MWFAARHPERVTRLVLAAPLGQQVPRKRALDRGVEPGTGVLAADFVEGPLAQAELVAEQAGL